MESNKGPLAPQATSLTIRLALSNNTIFMNSTLRLIRIFSAHFYNRLHFRVKSDHETAPVRHCHAFDCGTKAETHFCEMSFLKVQNKGHQLLHQKFTKDLRIA